MGNIYLAGYTYSQTGIATAGAFQETLSGGGFVVKFDSSGNRIWGTYYGAGGAGYDECTDICISPLGDVYVAGFTQDNAGYTTPGCHQPTYGGAQDAFLAKFNDAGFRIWGTYYGGSLLEESGGVSCDEQGNVYLAGETASANNIASTGAYKISKNAGFTDGFLVKFDSAGVRQWGTYFGGNNNDEINDISYDRNIGGMYICGSTVSTDGIATAGAYQVAYGGGALDAFIAKFDDSGNRLWGTYYGGNGLDSAACVVGNEGLIYISGETSSSNNIATAGSYQTSCGGSSDGFLARFDINGQLTWSTYYGGSGADVATGLGLSNGSDIFIAGHTSSSNAIATAGSHQDVYGGGPTDAFLAKFEDLGTATALVWATYYGGTDREDNANVACDNSDNVYLAGSTYSLNAIATPGSFKDTIYPGQSDAFLARFRNCDPPAQPDTITGPVQLCPGTSLSYTASIANGASSYTWLLPAGWTGSSNTNSINVTAGDSSGSIIVIALNGCDGSSPSILPVLVYAAPHAVVSVNGALLGTGSYSSYQWYHNGQPVAGATGQTYTYSQQGDYYVHVTDMHGCAGNSDTVSLFAANVRNVGNASMWLNVWPNPVTDGEDLSLSFSPAGGRAGPGGGTYSVSISDMAGKTLLSDAWDGKGSRHIDLHSLSSGSYLLVLRAGDGNSYRRVLVKD